MSKTRKLSGDVVFEALKEKIEKRYFFPGDRLPSENDLAEEYGVSRATIRTAITKLGALGFVETRTGGGTYVAKFDFLNLIDSVSGLMFANLSQHDIGVYRSMIETATIDLVATKPVLSRFAKELQNCINRMAKAGESGDTGDKNAFAQADYEFHLWLCRMTENSMFVYAYELLKPVMIQYFQSHYDLELLPDSEHPTETLGGSIYKSTARVHQMILDCILQGDFEKAKSIIVAMAGDEYVPIETTFLT